MDEERNLESLKKDYVEIESKYSLPSFDELNKEFTIEKLAEVETDYLVREIRKSVADRLYNYMRFIETMLNPQNAPLFVFSIIKTMGEEDKKKLSEIYTKLSKNEIALIKLDLYYDEEKEAEFIKESYKLWQGTKKDMFDLMENVEKKLGEDVVPRDNKAYFG